MNKPRGKRRWWQFSLRSLLLLPVVFAVGWWWTFRPHTTFNRNIARIPSDAAKFFDKSATRIDFEKGPNGRPLNAGVDLSRRFVAWGCLFSTSAKGSYVAVQTFNVGGRSGGHSAATLAPLYQGTITVRFCVPGAADKPAGVHNVGLWVSHVTPDGTELHAFDKDGNEIHMVKAISEVRDFLGIHSPRPIARVEIVPVAEIDPDYAIDDVTFDKPAPLR